MIYYQVTYYSPGTFFAESSGKEFSHFSLREFSQGAKAISERYNATPHSFVWAKMEKPDSIPQIERYKVCVDPNTLEESGYVYLTGDLVFARDLSGKDKEIWKSNLVNNSGGIGIINKNSFLHHGFFREEDIIVDWDGNIVRRGDDADLMEIRRQNKLERGY